MCDDVNNTGRIILASSEMTRLICFFGQISCVIFFIFIEKIVTVHQRLNCLE